ncbi:hypothetical protein B7463_g11345, partial [Scytalidium lignicola]
MSDQNATTPRVYIARHGETEWTINGRCTGKSEIPLTANGLNPRVRAQTTLDLLLGDAEKERLVKEGKISITEDIAEWDYGDYEGLKPHEIREHRKERDLDKDRSWDIWIDGCQGGESPQQVEKRLDALIQKIYDLQAPYIHGGPATDVLLVAHGHILRAFTKRWLKLGAVGRRGRIAGLSVPAPLGFYQQYSLGEAELAGVISRLRMGLDTDSAWDTKGYDALDTLRCETGVLSEDMHHALQPRRSFLSRTSKRRSGESDSLENIKGAFGLHTLHTSLSGSVNADLIFVHGLGGGSRSTWTKDSDPSLFWPKEWLSKDEAFQDVRLHTFGYNSDWGKESILGIHDFANTLLGCILDCPTIPRDSTVPIVLIGHSMGGLVIKRAYLLATRKREFATVASRVRVMFFLATPHRGAGLAQTLTKLLRLSGPRPFVTDLHRNSLAIQSINDEFPHCCQHLQLYSFFETIPTNFGIKKSLVVDKDLAIMGYANERRDYLDANHREVCKYASQDDPNYVKVRNALASALDFLRHSLELSQREIAHHQRRQLSMLLDVPDSPEDDFMAADILRMSGSCEWLIDRATFQGWLHGTGSPIYFLTAKPGTGKTVLSGKVVSHLRNLHHHCDFFFFQQGSKHKSNIAVFLLSIAWQMAASNERILEVCLEICKTNDELHKAGYRTIWRKLFLEGILKVKYKHTCYWVIDALDECENEADVIPFLIKIAEFCSTRIFLTSRNRYDSSQKLIPSAVQVLSEDIQQEDSKADIALYLDVNMDELPSFGEKDRKQIAAQILEKSQGCFLWVKLVFQELIDVHTPSDVQKILDEVPSDMNEMFAQILHAMSKTTYGKTLSKGILTWIVCSTRPLKTSELHEALQLDFNDSIDNIEASIKSCCGQLVYIDTQSRVQMIHLTARDFLLQQGTGSEFAIDETKGHLRLLYVCLQYLNGDHMKGPRRGKYRSGGIPKEYSDFASYACNSLCEHISHVSWMDKDALRSLIKLFNSTNVLSWIEYIARHSDLHLLIQTSNALSAFLQDSSPNTSLFAKELELLSSWATDLKLLVMRFGRDLKTYPSSIFYLIPPFCPPITALRKQFGSATRGISVRGLRVETWDDCLSIIVHTQETYLSVASSKAQFAIGCWSGKILLLNQMTGHEIGSLQHEEPVRLLKFGDKKNILVSAGSKVICVWDLALESQLWRFDTPQQCMALALNQQDRMLLGAFKDHRLKLWDLKDGNLTGEVDWTQGPTEMTARLYRRPVTAAFSMEAGLLAIVYRGHDILLWDLESNSLYDTYSRESGAVETSDKPYATAGVRCLVFGNAVNANLLASAYVDGGLIVFDTSTGEIKNSIDVFVHLLDCSPDGSTLAAADPSGTIQLFKFETMQLICRINPVEPSIKSLSFSQDSLHLLDIRGSRCRVWGPTVLVGQDKEPRDSASIPIITPNANVEPPENITLISSVACHDSGEIFFCGKEDGSVSVYDIKSGLSIKKLFSHAQGVTISLLYFEKDSHTLTSVDLSSRVMIHRLTHHHQSIEVVEGLFDHRVETSVDQLVHDAGLNHILVCTETTDMLWSISKDENVLVSTISYQDREPYRWVNHPTNPDHLILITNNKAHIFEWKTLKRLTGPTGILMEGNISSNLSIRSITPCFNDTTIVSTYREQNRPHSKARVVFWNISEFNLESVSITPIAAYSDFTGKVELLIGITSANLQQREQLVFLHEGNWICTVNSLSAKLDRFIKHFFFPADWLSTNLDLIVEVTTKGDIILVKGDEAAVVRRGLLASDVMGSGALTLPY